MIAGGDLVSLDMTINATFDVAAVAFNATDLTFDYTAATDSFSMSGSVGVTVAGIDGLTVTFGSGGTPGLVIAQRRPGQPRHDDQRDLRRGGRRD